jgi:hypothetical protein
VRSIPRSTCADAVHAPAPAVNPLVSPRSSRAMGTRVDTTRAAAKRHRFVASIGKWLLMTATRSCADLGVRRRR